LTWTDGSKAIAAGATANLIWGLSPLMVNPLGGVSAVEVLANRYAWTGLFALCLTLAMSRGRAFLALLRNRRLLAGLFASSSILAFNWGWYIWAVPHGHTLDAALGQLLIPLATLVLARFVVGERLNLRTAIAVLAGVAGTVVLAIDRQGIPWVVIVIPVTFSTYGLLRKIWPVEPLVGVTIEMMMLWPLALPFLFTRPDGGALVGPNHGVSVLLAMLGLSTVVPFVLFSYAAQRIRLTTLGLLAYLPVAMQMAVAVLLLGEPFTPAHGTCLILVLSGLILYSLSRRKTTDRLTASD
jgi:chloramphenicol-sensitive protein RarD